MHLGNCRVKPYVVSVNSERFHIPRCSGCNLRGAGAQGSALCVGLYLTDLFKLGAGNGQWLVGVEGSGHRGFVQG